MFFNWRSVETRHSGKGEVINTRHKLPPTSNIVTQQKFVLASWSSICFNKCFQLATTKFCRVTMLEGWVVNTCSNAFQLATWQCCVAGRRKMLPALARALKSAGLKVLRSSAGDYRRNPAPSVDDTGSTATASLVPPPCTQPVARAAVPCDTRGSRCRFGLASCTPVALRSSCEHPRVWILWTRFVTHSPQTRCAHFSPSPSSSSKRLPNVAPSVSPSPPSSPLRRSPLSGDESAAPARGFAPPSPFASPSSPRSSPSFAEPTPTRSECRDRNAPPRVGFLRWRSPSRRVFSSSPRPSSVSAPPALASRGSARATTSTAASTTWSDAWRPRTLGRRPRDARSLRRALVSPARSSRARSTSRSSVGACRSVPSTTSCSVGNCRD